MKVPALIVLICLSACGGGEQKTVNSQDTTKSITTAKSVTAPTKVDSTIEKIPARKVFSNTRFREVTVKHLGNNKYNITGKAQIFEANFSWVIEDGHNELQTGHTITDAGAPEWGNFNFTVEAKKKRQNSTLHIILFESSAKDGSRQYELPVLLY